MASILENGGILLEQIKKWGLFKIGVSGNSNLNLVSTNLKVSLIQNGGRRQFRLKISINFKTSALVAILENGGLVLEEI